MNALLTELLNPPPSEAPSVSPPRADFKPLPSAVPARSALATLPKPPIAKLRYEHRAMAKMIAANPTISQNELAEMFGYSPSWISTIIASDAFQAILFEEMEKSDFPAEARAQAKLQISGILHRSMEVLRHKLDKDPEKIPDQLALQAFKASATSLGMGVKDVHVSVTETHNHLNELGENLVGLLRRHKSAVIEGSVEPGEES